MKTPSATFTLLLSLALSFSLNIYGCCTESHAARNRQNAAKQHVIVSQLTLRIADPGCPSCLHSLKKYLLSLGGVRQVNLPDLNHHGEQRVLIEFDSKVTDKAGLIAKIKHRDFKINGTASGAPAWFQSSLAK